MYEYLQDLAKADNSSINNQVKTILQQALSVQIQQAQERRRQNILNLLEESRRRESRRQTDVEWRKGYRINPRRPQSMTTPSTVRFGYKCMH